MKYINTFRQFENLSTETFKQDVVLSVLRKNLVGQKLEIRDNNKSNDVTVNSINKVELVGDEKANIFINVDSDFYTSSLVITVCKPPSDCFVRKREQSDIGRVVGSLNNNDAHMIWAMVNVDSK